MFKKLIITAAVVTGVFASGSITAQAFPLCAKNHSLCKMPINPIPVGPIKYKPLPFPLPPGPLPAPPTPAPGPSFGINVNLGGGSYADGGFVSCHQAKRIVRQHGYRHVQTDMCGDGDYTFLGTKHGAVYSIDVSDSGDIIGIDLADNGN